MNDIITLDNGLRIVTDPISYVRSASFGVWIESGSVHEDKSNEGISHFIEHMAFKGTKRRSAMDIASEFDEMGGQANAFTSKEMTCFFAKTLDTHILQGFDILSDMILNSKFNSKDIKTEKNVVIEEIAMSEDSPEDLVVDRLCEAVWDGHPLANTILGRNETVNSFNTKSLKEYISNHYGTQNTVITISGSYNNDDVVSLIKEKFSALPNIEPLKANQNALYTPNVIIKDKDTEQNHICIGFNSYNNAQDDEYYALSVFNTIFGGGMSSRLFQKIREQAGLAYSIYSFPIRHKEGGLFCIYAALNPSAEEKVISLIFNEINLLLKNGFTNEELSKAREQLKAGVIMGLESTSSRSTHMGRSVLMHGRIKSLSEIIAKIDEVDYDRANKVAKDLFNFEKLSFSVVGRTKSLDLYKKLLNNI